MSSIEESFLMLARIFIRIFPASLAIFVSFLSFIYSGVNIQKVLQDWEKRRRVDRMPFLIIVVFAGIGSLALTLAIYFSIQMARVILAVGGI